MHVARVGTRPMPAPITRCHDATLAGCALLVEMKLVTEKWWVRSEMDWQECCVVLGEVVLWVHWRRDERGTPCSKLRAGSRAGLGFRSLRRMPAACPSAARRCPAGILNNIYSCCEYLSAA